MVLNQNGTHLKETETLGERISRGESAEAVGRDVGVHAIKELEGLSQKVHSILSINEENIQEYHISIYKAFHHFFDGLIAIARRIETMAGTPHDYNLVSPEKSFLQVSILNNAHDPEKESIWKDLLLGLQILKLELDKQDPPAFKVNLENLPGVAPSNLMMPEALIAGKEVLKEGVNKNAEAAINFIIGLREERIFDVTPTNAHRNSFDQEVSELFYTRVLGIVEEMLHRISDIGVVKNHK